MSRVKRTGFDSMAKTMKTLTVNFNTIDKAKNSVASQIKIDIKTKTIQKVLKQTEKFPYEARKAFKETLQIIANDLWAALDENMEAEAWGWNGDTRDIVDTGALRDSGRVYLDGDDIVITYSEDYAAIVHFGGYVQSGFAPDAQIFYPARPWIEATLTGNGPVPKFNFSAALEENFFRILGQGALKSLLP